MITPSDIFYTPNLPGPQRAALKRAFHAFQAKRRGEMYQFTWVRLRFSKRVFVNAAYRKYERHQAWRKVRKGLRKPAGARSFHLNIVQRFYIGKRGGFSVTKKGVSRYVKLSEL